jgi:serine/threonine-protein kinase
MEPQPFFEHYRISQEYDGSPREISRSGPVVFYKGTDQRSGAPVSVTLLPVASVAPAERESFEEKARAALQLDHMNIAQVAAFGVERDQFAFVSELPQGETLEAWVTANEPMPPEAVLRVALQVVSGLSAASFYGLTHGAIQPANLMIVPGQTAEGGWPFVKLVNFGLAGLKHDGAVSEFSSPEQVELGTSDFRSEIYSLGATMCFLLTGAFYAAEPRSLQTRRFAKPLRKLIAPMLSENPDERPHDPILFAQALRKCLQTVERRQAWSRRFGVPFVAVAARPPRKRRSAAPGRLTTAPVPLMAALSAEPPLPAGAASAPEEPAAGNLRASTEEPAFYDEPRSWMSRPALAWAAVLLALLTLAAVLLPAPVGMILRRDRDKEAIGVPVGVPDPSASQVVQNAPNAAAKAALVEAPVAPMASASPANETVASSSPADPAIASQNSTALAQNRATPAPQPSPGMSPLLAANSKKPGATEARNDTQEVQPPAEGPQTLWDRASGMRRKIQIEKQGAAGDAESNDSGQAETVTKNETDSKMDTEATPSTNHKDVTSAARRPGSSASGRSRISQAPRATDSDQETPPARSSGSVHARYVGMTPEGNLILRFPSGEIAIVSPRAARLTVPPRHRTRRIVTERTYYPPPRPFYGPGY